ncbi:MAG: YHS domain-containing protein [Deltaproteobacteria bacterium]|nr:YHS domain-containing protein [Deltaproteobacteria bacterium]
MKSSIITLFASLVLALGLVACKSGGAQEGPASAPAAAADEHHDDGHHADGHHGHADEDAPSSFDAPPAAGTLAKCPVSGEVFTVEADTDRAEYQGKHYVFCCSKCAGKFEADPTKFVK